MLLAYLEPLSFLIQGKPNQEGKKTSMCVRLCVCLCAQFFFFFQLHRNYSNSNEVPAMPLLPALSSVLYNKWLTTAKLGLVIY